MKKQELTLLSILFLLALAIIFFSDSFIILSSKNYLSGILRPFEIVFSGASNKLSFWRDAIFNIKNLKEFNSRLILENLILNNKLTELSRLQEENSLLRESLSLKKRAVDNRLADVIGRDFQNNRSFIIDKGANDGVVIGMSVISQGETIIGRIVETNLNTSKVQTILDTQSRIAAITTTSKVSGLVRGLGSDVIFDLIAKNEKLEIGELIISSGTDGNWPKGLVIGKIKNIESRDNQVFSKADIELLAEPQNFNSVFIILNSQ